LYHNWDSREHRKRRVKKRPGGGTRLQRLVGGEKCQPEMTLKLELREKILFPVVKAKGEKPTSQCTEGAKKGRRGGENGGEGSPVEWA